ncbi:MAG: hypothetical protein JJ975_11895, partial [Bacteroidia bacterium]|nr:hypothetical protein [Bacteroidia bacterium]
MKSIFINSRVIILITIGTVVGLLQSCKDKVELGTSNRVEQGNHDHLKGNFRCTIQYQRYYFGGGNEEYSVHDYDRVIEIKVLDDTLHILEHKFPITSVGQVVFEEQTKTPGNSLTLTYSDHFNKVSLIHSSSVPFTPTHSTKIVGERVNLSPTIMPVSLGDLAGNYRLTVANRSTKNGTDTTFSDIFPVSVSNNRIQINKSSYRTSTFLSFDHREEASSTVNGITTSRQNIFW